MGISKDDAYRILELPRGATVDEVRASYKRLALKWHPDKHKDSPDATKKFQEVSSAYKRLTSDDSDDEIYLSMADMFDLFAHIFFHRNGMHSYCHDPAYESDDDNFFSEEDCDEDMEDELLHTIASKLRSKYDRSKTSTYNTRPDGKSSHLLSEAEALKNAEELIKEEERERKKAEKRRQKKKRNKEKRKQKDKDKKEQTDKENNQEFTNGPVPGNNKPVQGNMKPSGPLKENISQHTSTKEKPKNRNSVPVTSADEPGWDTSSAFFNNAAGRAPPSNPTSSADMSSSASKVATITATPLSVNTNNSKPSQVHTDSDVDPLVLQSRQIAVRGNEMANTGNYQAAIELFTQAVKLDARDFRFFGNRSYCFDRVGQFEKALQDADVAISLAPDWPKGYFRRGRALAGLKLYSDAENAFAHVLKLDKHCQDAMFELARVRVQQLEEMGFHTHQAEAAIQVFGTVQSALEALLAGKVECSASEEIYVSDGEEDHKPAQNLKTPFPSIDIKNECKSVWVGNVNSEVTESQLQQLFARCGRIETIKILPKKYCAFINYYTAESASKAIETLQGYEMAGQNFLLRFPNNNPLAPVQPQLLKPSPISQVRGKVTGPVNGDECYFWRTTGCAFGDKCRNKHVPGNRGCDLRRFEAKYGSRM